MGFNTSVSGQHPFHSGRISHCFPKQLHRVHTFFHCVSYGVLASLFLNNKSSSRTPRALASPSPRSQLLSNIFSVSWLDLTLPTTGEMLFTKHSPRVIFQNCNHRMDSKRSHVLHAPPAPPPCFPSLVLRLQAPEGPREHPWRVLVFVEMTHPRDESPRSYCPSWSVLRRDV